MAPGRSGVWERIGARRAGAAHSPMKATSRCATQRSEEKDETMSIGTVDGGRANNVIAEPSRDAACFRIVSTNNVGVATRISDRSSNSFCTLNQEADEHVSIQATNLLPVAPQKQTRSSTSSSLADKTRRPSPSLPRTQAAKAVVWQEYNSRDYRRPAVGPLVTITKEDGEIFYLEDRSEHNDAYREADKGTREMIERELEDMVGREAEEILRPGSRIQSFGRQDARSAIIHQTHLFTRRRKAWRVPKTKIPGPRDPSSPSRRPRNYVDLVTQQRAGNRPDRGQDALKAVVEAEDGQNEDSDDEVMPYIPINRAWLSSPLNHGLTSELDRPGVQPSASIRLVAIAPTNNLPQKPQNNHQTNGGTNDELPNNEVQRPEAHTEPHIAEVEVGNTKQEPDEVPGCVPWFAMWRIFESTVLARWRQ
ncbi:hypothetical protein QBC44DRAFT_403311 [Cladorrhinum sp. PSN332]|nr:hypothetical protein QBC44DRAFT_403311 [Cladorrhinum sp. PSN332]